MVAIRIENQSLHRPPYYQALVTTSYPTNTITRFHMSLKTSSLTATAFVRGLAFSYTIHTPLTQA